MSNDDASTETAMPMPAKVLGFAGLIPFYLPAIGMWQPFLAEFQELLFAAQFAYSAVILSFLGAVHWGRALANDSVEPDWVRLIWSITPALFGWALLIVPIAVPDPKLISVGFAVVFMIAYAVDTSAAKDGVFPAWYGKLRKHLTTGVLVSYILSLTAGTFVIGG